MKSAVLEKYDKKNIQLKITDRSVEDPTTGNVLVKVLTAGVNPLDNKIVHGEVKAINGYKFPLPMGNEFCGIVEKIGAGVLDFKPGERVYGRTPIEAPGAFSEYITVPASSIAKVPDSLSDEEAASVPLTALTAMQALELLHPKKGETVFISGGSGSFGAMAIPLAKSMGLKVITTGSAANEERVKKLGADTYLDYKTTDYSRVLSNVDHVIDTVGAKELPNEFKILKPKGTLVSLAGMPNEDFAKRTHAGRLKTLLFKAAGLKYDRMAAKKNQKYRFIYVHPDGKGLQKVSKVIEENGIKPSVDTVYPFESVNEALKKVEAGSSKGKTILKISDSKPEQTPNNKS